MGKIRKVPQIPNMHVEHYQFLEELRNAVVSLQQSSIPPDDPSNLAATPFALGATVQWTRSNNAQRYTVYISNTPTLSAGSNQESIAVDVGDSNRFTDSVGQSNFKRFYWVKAWNGNSPSRLVGPVVAVTLGAAVLADPPKQVSPGIVGTDQSMGLNISGVSVNIPGRGPKVR